MQIPSHPNTQRFRKIPLHFVIVVPFVLQIAGAVGLVGYLSFKNEQKAIENLASQLMSKVSDRIEERLDSYLATPHLINSINTTAINLGQLNPQDFKQLERQFWHQHQSFNSVTSIYWGNEQGDMIAVRRTGDGSFTLSISQTSDKRNLRSYRLDPQGNRLKEYQILPNYDARQRLWYKQAKAAGKARWSSIFPWIFNSNPGISAVTPIYQSPGKLSGVLGAGLTLSDISKFLNQLKISPSGQTFIMERSGEMIASSTSENSFIPNADGKKLLRIKAIDSQIPLTRDTATALSKQWNNLKNLKSAQQFEFLKGGKRQFVKVTPYRDKFGLDWLIVVVVPEADFMEQIHANTLTTALLSLGALGIAIALGVATARWITLPLVRLSRASQAIANGELNQTVEIAGIEEIVVLAQSFNQMIQHLQHSQQEVENYSRSLEEQVSQRTEQLQQEIAERKLLEEKLRFSENEIRTFFEAMTDIVLIIDRDGNAIKVAPTHPERLHGEDTSILDQTIEQFFLEEKATVFRSQIRRALETQQIINFEYSLPLGNRQIWFSASITPQSDNTVAWVARDISDRKQAEAELRKSEERWQLALQGNNDGIWDYNPRTREVFCSPRSKQILGYEDHEISNYVDDFLKKIHPDDVERVTKAIQDHLNRQTPNYSVEFRAQCKDGSDKWILSRGLAIWDEAGNPVRMVGSHTDITERKQREEALQLIVEGTAAETGSKFFHSCVRYLAQVLQVRYAIVTELVNTGCPKVRPLAFWTGEDWNDEIEYDLANTPCEHVIAKGRTCFYPDGVPEHFPEDRDLIDLGVVSYLGIPLFDSAGKVLGHLAVLDIKPMNNDPRRELILRIFSARAGVELERQQAEEKLRASQQRLSFLVQQTPVAVLEWNTNWEIVEWNQAAETIFGYRKQEVLQKKGVDLIVPPPLRSQVQQVLDALAINKGGNHNINENITKDGRIIICDWYNSPLIDEGGNIIGFASMAIDITERKQAEEEAIAANRSKSEFLANMSHELRTPLTAILGLSEVLRDEVFGPLTAKQHQKLATIEQSGQHLLELINDVLDLAKIESGKMELQLVPTDIQGLCEGSLAFVRQQAHQKQIKLSSEIPPRIGKVVVDERRMRQVLINLLSNAVKFTPEGGEVWIEVRTDLEAEVLHFSIVDTGIGIAKEDMGKLFQPFMQLDSSFTRRYKGTGLGLALVRQVVELHGGSVALESEVGNGSRFTVSIPWKPETISPPPYPPTSPSPYLPVFLPHTLNRILIVEDSAPAAEQVARYLEELGVTHAVMHALGTGTVEEALQLKPDAIILDLQLPDRSGWDVLAQLKANPDTQNIPVLIISVVDEPVRTGELGLCAYLVKPFSRSQFHIAWRKLVLAGQTSESIPPTARALPLILYAEDNEGNLSTIVEYLEVKGYRVAIALNGREAVQLTNQLNPDLILMDIQMPEMDGLEATHQIRGNPERAQIPIIALTSLAMPGDREKCLEAGVNDYLAKPVSLKKLLEAIAHHLNSTKS